MYDLATIIAMNAKKEFSKEAILQRAREDNLYHRTVLDAAEVIMAHELQEEGKGALIFDCGVVIFELNMEASPT